MRRGRPLAAISDAVSAAPRSSRSATATAPCPSAASASAIARPIPPPPPVTSATRPRTRGDRSHARRHATTRRSEMQELTDVRYEVEDGLAWITIDRPERMNAFRARTVDELIALPQARVGEPGRRRGLPHRRRRPRLLHRRRPEAARRDRRLRPVRVRALRGRVPAPSDPRDPEAGDRRGERLRDRRRPRPARALRPDDRRRARRGSARAARAWAPSTPASAPPTWPASWARSARGRSGSCAAATTRATAERWGLVNRVVPPGELRAEVRRWADEILALSPTALRFLKQSFNADTEHMAGLGQLAFSGPRAVRRHPTRPARASRRSTRSARRTSPPTGSGRRRRHVTRISEPACTARRAVAAVETSEA